jgi:hypothetical protein
MLHPQNVPRSERGYGSRLAGTACRSDLLGIVDLVRGTLTTLQRATLGALVVMDVHARDVVTQLAVRGVTSDKDFEWQAQLRSYWVNDATGDKDKTVEMHMMSAILEFGCAPSTGLLRARVEWRCAVEQPSAALK